MENKERAAFAKAVQAVAVNCKATTACHRCPYYRTHLISEKKESSCKLRDYPYNWEGNDDGK